MKKILSIIAFLVLLSLLAIFGFFFFSKSSTPVSTSPVQFPSSGSTSTGAGGSSAGSSAGKTITVPARGTGSPITVADFIHNGVTVPDPSNVGNYYLTSFSSTEYAISYNSSTQFFTIALEQEPIGQARRDAEQALQQALGISSSQLCNLNYYLGTDDHTNSTYAGKNLGFSFCPGATLLP